MVHYLLKITIKWLIKKEFIDNFFFLIQPSHFEPMSMHHPKEFLDDSNSGSNHYRKLFQMVDIILRENPQLSNHFCLSIAHYILSNMEPTFVERRAFSFFCFLLKFFCHEEEQHSSCRLTYFLHEVSFPFQKKTLLGLFADLKGVHGEIEDLKNTFLNHHPHLLLVEETTLPFIHSKQNRTFFYFEVQKEAGDFSPDDVENLLEDFEETAHTFVDRRKVPIPSIEASVKTLCWLMNDTNMGDIPSVFIDLHKEESSGMVFCVVLCATSPLDSSSFSELIHSPEVEETLRCNKDKKEGIIFKIELTPPHPFSFIEGRQKVCKRLQKAIGVFRDINGGLLEKIEKNFHALTKHFPSPYGLLRTFFDSITPEEHRGTTPIPILKEIYLEMEKMLQKNEGPPHMLIETKRWVGALFKVNQKLKKKWKTLVMQSFSHPCFASIVKEDKILFIVFLNNSNPEERDTFQREAQALIDTLQTEKEDQGTLRLCTTSHFNSFDPRTGTEEESSYLHKMLFEGLMRIGKTEKPEPAISHNIDISDNGKRYRFSLRKSTWSNGMPLTANDFLYSWRMILTQRNLAPLSYLFNCIQHAKDIQEGIMPPEALGAVALDDHTLEVQLLSPCTSFLEICSLTLFSPICQKIDETYPSWSDTQGNSYVCNGPFCLEQKEKTGGVILKKNPLYWEAQKVKLKHVTIPFVSQEEGKKLFFNKKVDALLDYFYKNPISLSVKNMNVKSLQGGTVMRYLCFDCSIPPFHNKKVRKAISLAVDREKIAYSFSKSAASTTSFFSPIYRFSRFQSKLEKDISQSRLLMIEAMTEDSLVYKTIFKQKLHALESSLHTAQLVCTQINEALGVNWDVCTTTCELSSTKNLTQPFGVRLYAWADRIFDPIYFLGIFSNAAHTKNPTRWNNLCFESIFDHVSNAQNDKQRKDLFHSAEKILWEELPMIPLFYVKTTSLHHKNMQGLNSNHLQEFDIRFASKEKESDMIKHK
ncbi:MAG: peptide ABC transporter substrate-binding protein [Candidatus Neptunochlamydia sp.]|nr:peptide ABC transporter substrate-binding protein [Candidatus Neptunochlamydia sp.]